MHSSRMLGLVWLSMLAVIWIGVMEAGAASASTDGVEVWGSNLSFGNLGRGGLCEGLPAFNPSYNDQPLQVPGLAEVKAIAAGTNDSDHELALQSNGTVIAWGENSYAQLGDGKPGTGPHLCDEEKWAYDSVPVQVGGLTKVKAIAAGPNHNLALLTNGTVMAWGENQAGELGDGTITGPETCGTPSDPHPACSSKPVPVCAVGASPPCSTEHANLLSEVTAVAAGYSFSLALLKNGTVVAWGYNRGWTLGKEVPPEYSDVPVLIPGLSNVKSIAAGWFHALALLKTGTIMAWGSNGGGHFNGGGVPKGSGDLGQETFTEENVLPAVVKGLAGKKAKAISAGREWSLAALTNGTAVAWGVGSEGQLGTGCNGELELCNRDLPTQVSGLTTVSNVAAGESNGLGLLKNGTAVSWGSNGGDQLGDGHEGGGVAWAAVTVFGLTGATSIAMGDQTALAAVTPVTPTVTEVSPHKGSAAGGMSVTVTGTRFWEGTTGTSFKFGTTNAKSVNCPSTTECTVVAPAHAVGTVDIEVTVSKLTSAANPPGDQFTYE